MKEEDRILKEIGKENPFTVPENYFDDACKEIVGRLPEKEFLPAETPSAWEKIRPWLYMAAMFVAILLPIRFMMERTSPASGEGIPANEYGALSVDECIDYAILNQAIAMDDYSFYEYMDEEYEENND